MFNASHLYRCHLLLGNLALIVLSGLILLDSLVIGNDINLSNKRIRLFKNQNRNSSSVQTNSVNYLPQLDFYRDIFKNRYDAFYNSNYETYENNRNENDESTIFRFKKENSIKNKLNSDSNERSSTIKSNKIYLKSTRPPPVLYTSSNDIFLSNEEKIQVINNIANDINKIMTTTISSINLESTKPSTTSTTSTISTTTTSATIYKGSTNYGHKNYYDREWSRTKNRMNKEASLVSWNELLKLIFLLLVCTAGTTGNIFVISSITVIEQFQTQGNVYIVSLALGQLLITVIALPGTCVEIMAVKPNHPTICHLQWIFTQFTLIITLLSFMFISVENCSALRIRAIQSHNIFCSKFRVILLVILTWLIAGLIVYTQNTYELAPAFCKQAIESNKNKFWLQYHLSVGICVILLPTLITVCCFIRCSLKVKKINEQFELNPLNSPWQNFAADGELVKANVMVYIFMFFTHLPLCIIGPLTVNKQVNQEWLNASWYLSWFGSCFYSFVYAFFNQNFGKAFFKLFYYCCCKSHLQFDSKTTINLRRNLAAPSTNNMELRVHIIPGLNMNQRTHDHHHSYLNHHHHNLGHTSAFSGGRHPDGGLGPMMEGQKWHSRVDSRVDQNNYSSNSLMNRARNYTYGANNYSSHLVDSKDYYFGN